MGDQQPDYQDLEDGGRWSHRGSTRLGTVAGAIALVLLPLAGLYFWLRSGDSSTASLAQASAVSRRPASAVESESEPANADVAETAASPAEAAKAESIPEGPIEIGVAYGTEKKHWLQAAVQKFAVSPEGESIHVNLIPMGSVEGAHSILDGNERIHVWAPASKMYLQSFLRDWRAKHREDPIVDGEALALTPMVIVMWKTRYDAFLTRAPEVSLKMIGYGMNAPTGWGAIADKPEWGHFKFAHTHPNQSNSGFMSLIVLAHSYYQKTSALTVGDVMSKDFQRYLARFERGVTGLSNSTGNMMSEMVYLGPACYDAVMVYESLAIEYFKKAEGRWGSLQVVYPAYNVWNDNPYYVLDVPWSSDAHKKAAQTFLDFLMSEPIQAMALDHGFRPGNPSVPVKGPTSPFVEFEQFGLKLDIPAVCEPPSPEVIENLQQSWIRSAVPR